MTQLLDRFYIAILSFFRGDSLSTYRVPVIMTGFISFNWISATLLIFPYAEGVTVYVMNLVPFFIITIFLHIYYGVKRRKNMIERLKQLSEKDVIKYRKVLILYVIITVGLLVLASELSVKG